MRNTHFSVAMIGLALSAVPGCGGSMPMTSPTQAAAPVLGLSIQSVVMGLGSDGSVSTGAGATLTVRPTSSAMVSARLEVAFTDGSTLLDIPFDPVSVRLAANSAGTLSVSFPGALDPRLGGRKASSFRGAVTVRDDAFKEQTVFVNFSSAQK